MRNSMYIPLALGVVFLLAFIAKCNKKRSVIGLFLKVATSVCFIGTGALAAYHNHPDLKFPLLVIVGLVFGILGDIFLDLKWLYTQHKDEYLYAGFTVFAIGHVFYCTAMGMRYGFGWKDFIFPVILGIIVVLFNVIIEKPSKQNFGKFRPAVLSYAFVLAFMAGCGLWAAFTVRTVETFMLAAGGVFFLLSDLVLSPMYFKPGSDTPLNFVINHVTYYLAQYLIAMSILFI